MVAAPARPGGCCCSEAGRCEERAARPRGWPRSSRPESSPRRRTPTASDSIVELLGDVSVLAWLPSGGIADRRVLATVNGERLGSLLERLVDTPVRGLVYEAAAGADPGRPLVADAADRWRIPVPGS